VTDMKGQLVKNLAVNHVLHIITFYYTKRLLTKQGVFCALTICLL